MSLQRKQLQQDSWKILPNGISVSSLDCPKNCDLLSPRQSFYAYHLSKTVWYRGLAVLLQESPELPYIYNLLICLFCAHGPEQLYQYALAGFLTEEEYQTFLFYTSWF